MRVAGCTVFGRRGEWEIDGNLVLGGRDEDGLLRYSVAGHVNDNQSQLDSDSRGGRCQRKKGRRLTGREKRVGQQRLGDQRVRSG